MSASKKTYAEALREFELKYWSSMMHRHSGKISSIAKEAGVLRTSCYRTLSRLGLIPAPVSNRARFVVRKIRGSASMMIDDERECLLGESDRKAA
jgi:hypothetical protein